MKKILLKILTALIISALSFNAFGCDFSADDVNGIVDNAFENYSQMNSTETGSYSKFKDINVQSSYLGYGYDVINDPYMDVKKIAVSYPILDLNKIENVNLMMQKVNNGAVDKSYGSTMEEFYNDYATSVNVYGKMGKFFSGGLKLDFSGSASQKSYWYFYKLSYYFDSFYIHITDTVDSLQNYLSDGFKNDVINMPIDQLFDRYGTHLIKEAAMGGRVEKSLTYSSESSNNKSSMSAAVNAHIKIMGASINAEAFTSANSELSQAGVEYKSKITQLGGKAISLVGDVDYDKWASSFDESLEYATLCGIVGENSLVGLWDLLPSGYESRATEMKNRFVELSGSKYQELLDMFKLSDVIEEEPEDTSWELITEKMEKYNCYDNQSYKESQKNPDEEWYKRHEGWELGELNFYGLEKSGNKYVVKNPQQFRIKYNLLENILELPLGKGVAAAQSIASDTANAVANTNISETIGKGAYWIRITYTDDFQKEVNKTNFLDGKTKGTFIELLSNEDIDQNKTIEKIEVVLVYEMYAGGPGFLGIWWNNFTNWRCEYTLEF